MRRAGRVLGYLCGIAFAILLIFMIVWMIQGTPDIHYGKVAIVLFVLAIASERLTKL